MPIQMEHQFFSVLPDFTNQHLKELGVSSRHRLQLRTQNDGHPLSHEMTVMVNVGDADYLQHI
jgi:hypothetical protein